VVQQNLLPQLLDCLSWFRDPTEFNTRFVMAGQANLMLKFTEESIGIAHRDGQWLVNQM
jgi:hypothetical protein